MSPSYLRLYTNPSPYLEEILTGSEPANGCYYEGGKPAIRNLYGMSEAGFIVLETPLERSYDVAPVGKPALDEIDLHIVDEEGKRIEGPGRGELCFKNEYVRGYLNLPDKTSKVFVNGIYHSGDLCERDESGMYCMIQELQGSWH